jgi:hypothetical protein
MSWDAVENIWAKKGWSNMKVEKITYMELHDLYFSPSHWSDHVKEEEMGKACETFHRKDKGIENFGRQTWSKDTKRKTKVQKAE